MKEGMQKSMPA